MPAKAGVIPRMQQRALARQAIEALPHVRAAGTLVFLLTRCLAMHRFISRHVDGLACRKGGSSSKRGCAARNQNKPILELAQLSVLRTRAIEVAT